LTGLNPTTLYHFQVASEDSSNNISTSSDYTFTTQTPPDTTPPVVVVLSPASGSTASGTAVLLSASSTDNVAVAGVTFYINGVKIAGELTSSTTIFSENWDSTATSSGIASIIAVARDTSNNYATSTPVSFTILNVGETPTLVSAAATSSSATITWTTFSAASSRVYFGPTALYGSSTSELDTSPRVTSHSVTISALVPCALYHYEVVSRNSGGDAATSSDETFNTSGCTGSSTITALAAGTIATSTGGTVSGNGISLTVPPSFTATSSSVVFQENQLNNAAFFATAGVPTGMNAASSNVVDLKAFTDATTTLTTFTQPLSVTLSYTLAEVSGLNLSTLAIYQYDSGVWTLLSNCSTNATAMTVTCTTMNFSTFAIFGQPAPQNNTTTNSGSGTDIVAGGGGGSVTGQYANLVAMGLTTQADLLASQYPWLFASTSAVSVATSSTTILGFTRYLEVGSKGTDVTELQQFLNEEGYAVASSGPGSAGNETDYFGALTKNALIKFQDAESAEILAPAGLKSGTGIFGYYTMLAVNKMLAAGTAKNS
jgi:hypothetical protein